jgi:uridine kinase
MEKPIIIGIAGGSASGKSVLSRRISEEFKDNRSVMIIKMDDYYNNQSHMTMEQRVLTNYDHPFAFDIPLLVEQLDLLIQRETIYKPTYDFVNHTRSNVTDEIEAADVILIEGLFVLEEESIRSRCDIKIYVDTPADLRFIRRLKRDVRDRGRTLESVINQYMTTVRNMHEQFIEPSKKYADLIIPEGGYNKVAIDLIGAKISKVLGSKI